ncbi:MAG TPA: histidine kinase dimerization/phospho-acceptor domain-containing protein, partial [Thermodesulfobacteriota bacterium]|nr:histidine kinase dimerization/phospho-acceptor domain-containing protein [Thermodesulfobacteriota bacterium]
MEKEVNCTNSSVILNYIKTHHDGDFSVLLKDLHPEIDSLPDPEKFLKDPNNWISSDVAAELYKRAKAILNDDMAPFNIARFAIEKTNLGFKSLIVKIFASYEIALKNAQRLNAKWNRNKEVEVVNVGRNEGTVRLHWNPSMKVTKDICLYNKGIYTFLPILWGDKPTNVRETACYFEGAPFCEYHLEWPERKSLFSFVKKFFQSKSVLVETIKEIEESKEIIEQKYEEVNRLNIELNRKIKQLLAIQETGKAILSILNLEQLLSVIMSLLANVCQINRATIMLVNEEQQCLEYIYGMGYGGDVPNEVKNYKVPLDRLSNILARVTSTGQSEYIPEVKSSSLRKENILLASTNPTSVYVAPLITRSKVIGVIATDAVGDKGVPQETRETLEIFAPQIAIAIQNARLYQRLHDRMEELKQSRALLGRAEKLSFLGNLAARLAHEIKNPLTAIGTFLQMLPKKYDDEEFRNEFYKIALEETYRVNNLITELLDLSKTRESHFEMEQLHTVIEKMVMLVSPQTKSKQIDVVTRLDPDVEKAWMDSEKIKEVILNLLSNAIEFTPNG